MSLASTSKLVSKRSSREPHLVASSLSSLSVDKSVEYELCFLSLASGQSCVLCARALQARLAHSTSAEESLEVSPVRRCLATGHVRWLRVARPSRLTGKP